MSEWLVVAVMIFMYAMGFVHAWALSHEDNPFWSAFLDGLTLRRLWSQS